MGKKKKGDKGQNVTQEERACIGKEAKNCVFLDTSLGPKQPQSRPSGAQTHLPLVVLHRAEETAKGDNR